MVIQTGEVVMYGVSIGIKPQNMTQLIARIKKGLPLKTFGQLCKNLAVPEKELCRILKIPLSTLARRKKSGQLSFEESERVFRIARLYDKAVEVFKQPEFGRKWLKEPAWALGDVAPLDYADTELGAKEVEDLLGRIEHGVFT
jgi:putative toxin-antitoxin system antitoxin component (TIGR02293 family)